MSKTFNPKDWLEVPKEQNQPKSNTATTNFLLLLIQTLNPTFQQSSNQAQT